MSRPKPTHYLLMIDAAGTRCWAGVEGTLAHAQAVAAVVAKLGFRVAIESPGDEIAADPEGSTP